MTLQSLLASIESRFDERFLFTKVVIPPNHGFTSDDIKSFITTYQEELLAAVVEEIDKRIPEDPEAHGWEGIFSIKERCCPGDDFGEGWCRALSDLKNTLLQAKSSGV